MQECDEILHLFDFLGQIGQIATRPQPADNRVGVAPMIDLDADCELDPRRGGGATGHDLGLEEELFG
jgi:hypothetical protein